MESLNSKTYHAAVYLQLSREDGDVGCVSKIIGLLPAPATNMISYFMPMRIDFLSET